MRFPSFFRELLIMAALIFAFFQSVFIVQEGQKAFVLRLGSLKLNQDKQPMLYQPGWHLKYPFIERPYYLDSRYQLWVTESDRVQSVEQLYLLVDFYVQWTISDYPVFFRVHAASGMREWSEAKRHVETLLKQKIRNAVLEQFGRRPLSRLISEDRKEIMDSFGYKIGESLEALGIKLLDFRLKKIELPEDVSEKIYNRMRTERQKNAAMHRAKGREKAENIKAQTDYEVNLLKAQSTKEAIAIEGSADAFVASIYGESHEKNLEFYEFFQSLETYKKSFGSQDKLILSTEMPFFDPFYQREKL